MVSDKGLADQITPTLGRVQADLIAMGHRLNRQIQMDGRTTQPTIHRNRDMGWWFHQSCRADSNSGSPTLAGTSVSTDWTGTVTASQRLVSTLVLVLHLANANEHDEERLR